MRAHIGWLTLGLGAALAGPLAAQSKGVELGLDAGFSTELKDPKFSTISIPVQRFRVGFFASDRVEVEPAIALNWLKYSGEDAATTLNAALGVLVHFTTDPAKARPYLRPFIGASHVALSGNSSTQMAAGAGLGVKLPISGASNFAVRLEAGYTHGFKNTGDNIPSTDSAHLLFGLSFFTK